MISVLILTRNEEANLPACLDSVRWSDDVLVLDSFSTDRTLEVARERGARVAQNRFVDFAQQRNHGIDLPGWKHDWILHLDADERVTPALRDEMMSVIQSEAKDAYRVASKMMFEGRWLKHSGLYPSYQVRFGRRAALRFVQVGHGQRESLAPERLGTLREALEHYSFSKGLDDWFKRHNRYSTAEAQQALAEQGSAVDWPGVFAADTMRRRRALKQLFARLPFRPALRFGYMYFLRRGFLDGGPGFRYCRLLSTYETMTVLKLREMRRRQRGEQS